MRCRLAALLTIRLMVPVSMAIFLLAVHCIDVDSVEL